ncbi:exostosin domain-containing protein [Ruegeria marina]|uniref:Exostosin family protein n=1 Tax=Ruegeria marina TaxID=639004 RepID=A0A1G7E5W0_9RHOB|nr:exostosin family protein [Ruegeria marina]SDE59052.1 Exostosin family protein [Ruegeria marina]
MPESTLHVLTPCLNARATIDRTVLSIVTQSGDFAIRYHIQDGGSTDGTLERLAWWRRRLNSRGFPLCCLSLDFTFSSTPDAGLYDTICKGFDALNPPSNAFMTWVTTDDVLMPGALAFIDNVAGQFTPEQISWVGGASAVMRGDIPTMQSSTPMPKEVLRAGLCDGVHWDRPQRGGTFFRKWMWSSINPKERIAPMKLAGDWNLWRLFAGKASLTQARFPLAASYLSEDRPPGDAQEAYLQEIGMIVPEDTRRQALGKLGHAKADIRYRFVTTDDDDPRLRIMDAGGNAFVSAAIRKVLDDAADTLPSNENTSRQYARGNIPDPSENFDLGDIIWHRDNIVAYDKDWQFPAITEQHAFHQMRDVASVPDGVTYVAYPWANLIDKLQTGAMDASLHMRKFQEFIGQLPKGTLRVTTCQHIKMREFLHLFEQAGISHIFWSHATHRETVTHDTGGFAIHPFPLYPVQVPEADSIPSVTERPYLFSFIGAKSNQYYMTRAREWILDLLKDHPKGLIIGRDNWHYNKVVYEHQIKPKGTGGNADDLIDKPASEQFKISMAKSIFSLCPSGTGPNSIRLWETLGAGAIPVILADTYAPPGNPDLWQAGAVICKEDAEAIAALPARLEEIAADPARLEKMRKVGQQLWLIYGPHAFVYDIQKLMLRLAQDVTDTGDIAGPQTSGTFREMLAADMADRPEVVVKDAVMLLRVCAGDLLLEGPDLLKTLHDDSTLLGQMVQLSQDALAAEHPTLKHFRNVVSHAETQAQQTRKAAPRRMRKAGLGLCFVGRHSNRTPLSYEGFQQVLGGRIRVEQDPFKADVVMTGFNLDLKENPELFGKLVRERPETRIMVISEEPLWDSLWSGGFASTSRKIKCGDTDVAYTFLNHSNSAIYDFDRIPYFLLTDNDLLARYGLLIKQNSALSSRDLLARWNNAPISAAFIAEKREGDKYEKSFPDHALYGLSSYRSEVAAKTRGKGVLREGKGWHSDKPRQDLPDWHLDKLAALTGRVRVMSSFENTHQHHYISEKIIDAFVVGGIPTYYADENHGIYKLVSPACMINTFGQSASAAAKSISETTPNPEMAEAWLETAQNLQSLLVDHKAILAERHRIAEAVLKAIETS